MNRTYRICSFPILLFCLLFTSCNRHIEGEEYESQVVKHLGVRNYEYDSIFVELLPQLNEMMKEGGSNLVIKLSGDFNFEKDEEILLIPITPFGKSISASSNLDYRFILINPDYINTIMYEVMLDTEIFKDIASILLIHELCHFELGKAGLFDEIITESLDSNKIIHPVNYQSLTEAKFLELEVDSMAVTYIEKASKSKNNSIYKISSSLKKQLGILEASVAIDRITNLYGTPELNVLNDLSKTHPNFELRLAFMNYYLNPSESKKRMIEKFLKEREVKIGNE